MSALAALSPAAPSMFDEPEAEGPSLTLAAARYEDAYWERCYHGEGYYRSGCNYEDYAPAYCAGYVGFAQYGGSFEDAERSLVSNWLRIRGDSRLNLEEAGLAMRAAWRRMEQSAARTLHWSAWQAVAAADVSPEPEARQDAGADALQPAPAGWQRSAPQALTARL